MKLSISMPYLTAAANKNLQNILLSQIYIVKKHRLEGPDARYASG
jgi:hypothetical protein